MFGFLVGGMSYRKGWFLIDKFAWLINCLPYCVVNINLNIIREANIPCSWSKRQPQQDFMWGWRKGKQDMIQDVLRKNAMGSIVWMNLIVIWCKTSTVTCFLFPKNISRCYDSTLPGTQQYATSTKTWLTWEALRHHFHQNSWALA